MNFKKESGLTTHISSNCCNSGHYDMQFTNLNLMSVWSFQGGMELFTEFRADGQFIDRNLTTKK